MDEPIPIASRYLTTVRRATSNPRSFSIPAIASSLKTSVSVSVTCRIAAFTDSAAAPATDKNDGTHPLGSIAGELTSGLGTIGAKLSNHVGEIVVVHATNAFEVGHPALRQEVEVLDEPRHCRVVAIGSLGLECKA